MAIFIGIKLAIADHDNLLPISNEYWAFKEDV